MEIKIESLALPDMEEWTKINEQIALHICGILPAMQPLLSGGEAQHRDAKEQREHHEAT